MDTSKIDVIDDLLEIEEQAFSIKEIEKVAKNPGLYTRYKSKFKDDLHTKLLLALTHESFAEQDAKLYWFEILNHMLVIEKKLDREVGLTVSTLDYLSNIAGVLREPRIIEKDKSYFIVKTSLIDELTGLYLRDVFDMVLKKEFSNSKRTEEKVTLLMLDIDDFKKVNDTFGHLEGDKVLRIIGQTINSCIREMDIAARYGGEEIAVIMPNTIIEKAMVLAERLREKISLIHFEGFRVTVSIGVSQYNEQMSSETDMIERADKALYQAKANGKNRVVKDNEE